jgi:hypothetical protein
MNSWMASQSFDTQCAHVLAGYSVIMTARLFWPRHVRLTAFIAVLTAGLKEFFYDARYELPRQTWKDNTLDFSMYCLGITIGCLV